VLLRVRGACTLLQTVEEGAQEESPGSRSVLSSRSAEGQGCSHPMVQRVIVEDRTIDLQPGRPHGLALAHFGPTRAGAQQELFGPFRVDVNQKMAVPSGGDNQTFVHHERQATEHPYLSKRRLFPKK